METVTKNRRDLYLSALEKKKENNTSEVASQ